METPPSLEPLPGLETQAGQPSRVLRWFAGFLFCVACIASILLARYKLQALLYHFVDFPYYLETTHQLLQPGARLSFNPDRFNCLGFFGSEAVRNIHQSAHMEPVKYGWALMGYLLKAPDFLFVFFAVMYFCPILYFSAHFKPRNWLDTAFGAIFVLMYCAFPSVANAVTFDLRPYALLAPACVLAVLSIRLERPIGEQLLFFNLMFFFREEAIILGVVVILYAASRASGPAGERIKSVFSMIVCWCGWAAVMAIYFRWTHYPNRFTPEGARRFFTGYPNSKMLLAAAIGCGVACLYIMWRFRRWIGAYRSSLVLILLLIPTGGMLLNMGRSVVFPQGDSNLIYGGRWAFIDVVILLILLDLWSKPWRPEIRRRGLASIAALCVVLVSLNFVGGQSVAALVNQCANRVGPAQLVWTSREQIPRAADVMTDYATLQAFTDFPHLTVFERMPVSMATGTDRFYPQNKPLLSWLLNDKTTYLILSRKNADDLPEILSPAALERLSILSENERYALLLVKSPGATEPVRIESHSAASRPTTSAVSTLPAAAR